MASGKWQWHAVGFVRVHTRGHAQYIVHIGSVWVFIDFVGDAMRVTRQLRATLRAPFTRVERRGRATGTLAKLPTDVIQWTAAHAVCLGVDFVPAVSAQAFCRTLTRALCRSR